jgi:CopG family transcriptional regulator, nickel-responsive regulator
MSDLVRFGVAMDRSLLVEFDRRIAARGYENRSEALRDLVRADLTRAAWDQGAVVAASITLVYDNRVRDLLARLCDSEGDSEGEEARKGERGPVTASLRVPLAPSRSLEVLAVQGAAPALSALAGRLAGVKGVLSCELTLASPLHDDPPQAVPRPEEHR